MASSPAQVSTPSFGHKSHFHMAHWISRKAQAVCIWGRLSHLLLQSEGGWQEGNLQRTPNTLPTMKPQLSLTKQHIIQLYLLASLYTEMGFLSELFNFTWTHSKLQAASPPWAALRGNQTAQPLTSWTSTSREAWLCMTVTTNVNTFTRPEVHTSFSSYNGLHYLHIPTDEW